MIAQRDVRYPETDDTANIKIFDGIAAVDQADFDEWAAKDEFMTLIDGAIADGRKAFAAAATLSEEEGDLGWALVIIDLGHPRSKPLVQALPERGLGSIEILSYTFDIGSRHIMGKRAKWSTYRQVNAVLDAFALALSNPGFEMQLWRE